MRAHHPERQTMKTQLENLPALLTEKQFSELVQVPVATLQHWRSTKRVEIPVIRIGRSIRYRLEDVKKILRGELKLG